VESFRAGSEKAIEAGHVEIIMGEASFTGPKSIRVRLLAGGTRGLSAELFVIDTGSRPADPPLRGLDSVPHFNSTSIMELGEVPEHLLILGGGYIAAEFGQMFRRFGSRVTIVERGRHLLAREDPDIADEVRKIFEEDGIKVALNASADGVDAVEGGAIRLQVTVGDDEQALVGSQLLVATGRKPNSEALNLAAAGVDVTDHGVIQVNGRLETSAAGIYALGEVAGSPAFTHISYDDFRVLRTNLIEGGNRSTHGRMLPYTVFTDPQLGRIGLTETEARDAQINVRVAIMPMTHVARALEMGESRGMVKAVVDADTEEILGAAVLGIEGGEIMAMLQLAMMGKLRYSQLRDGIFAHPTLAELLNNLFSGFK
jgi:pyruvate/2-oxoglutarate dehydrogenase complex dihydrolipoamide dehydrogenase (E3) component